MSAEEQRIKQIIGQLEASVNEAENVMDSETFDKYTIDMYHCIGMWRITLRKLKNGE